MKPTSLKPDFEYATNPALSFDGKRFCLTGEFDGHERIELEHCVARKGGTFTPNVSDQTDYLVIGSKGTRCCSFSCCKRVVEKAVDLRKQGASLQFIKESDFLKILAP
jgi:NAD-dependent DNA ligase